jgi:hypothetical protein
VIVVTARISKLPIALRSDRRRNLVTVFPVTVIVVGELEVTIVVTGVTVLARE